MEKNSASTPAIDIMALYREGQKAGAAGRQCDMVTGRRGEYFGHPYLVIPEGCRVEDMERFMLPPRKLNLQFDEVDSFIDFVNYYKEESTRLYCVESDGKFRAVIDEHPPFGGGKDELVKVLERALVGNLELKKTPEWAAWSEQMGKGLSQLEFALFLEDNGRFVVKPSSADFLQVALTLEAKKGVNFKSGIRLENGDHKLTFEEDTKTTAGVSGDMEIPHEFTIQLALYHGGQAVKLDGKLRYRIRQGEIVFFYKFPGLENVVREYVSGIRSRIISETNLPVWSMSALS